MTHSLLRPVLMVVVLLGGLGGCGSPDYFSDVPEPQGPATAQPVKPVATVTNGYTVRRGDTLYSIAFSVGKDWREVAADNGIAAPYTIYPGQVLRLGAAATLASMEPPAESSWPVGASSARTQAAPESGSIVAPVSSQPAAESSAPVQPSPPVQTVATAPSGVATQPVMPAEPRQPPAKPGSWQWPAAGKLLRGFSAGAQPHKGVDVDGNSGDPVFAANSGSVVYAGNGVRGYGNLLIVKHDETFLSAYAHNSKLLVKEGDVVRGGEKIAEIGDSGTDRLKLHFEVRKQGSPVDPLKILPRR